MEQEGLKNFPSIQELRRMVMQENLRLPRDLRLGGSKPKKIFKPNLNVVRNKDKGQGTNECVKKSQGHSKRLSNHSLRRANKKPKLLQSEGVFSQGIGEGKQHKRSSERSFTCNSGNSKTPLMSLPTISKSWQNIDKDDEKMILDSLLGDQSSDSESESESDEYSSITLPLEIPSTVKQLKQSKSQITHINIKKEEDDDDVQNQTFDEAHIVDKNSTIKIENQESDAIPNVSCLNTSKLYNDDNPAFMFMKLPDTFPGKVWKDTENKDNQDNTLQDMQDGQIGKILIRKSGKMELVVKNTTFVLNPDSAGNFVNAVMLFPGEKSIAMNPSLVTLGKVEEAVSFSPDWDTLFNRAKKNPKFYY